MPRGPGSAPDSKIDVAFTCLAGLKSVKASIVQVVLILRPDLKLMLETHFFVGGRTRRVPSRNTSFHFLAPRSEGVSEDGQPS
jgi:hypothetical protein